MGNAAWVRQVMRGMVITTERGERATITDIGNSGATLQPDGGGESLNISMRDIRTTSSLRARLRIPPSPSQVREAGVPEVYAAYLVPLIVVVRRAPGVQEWVQAERTDRRAARRGSSGRGRSRPLIRGGGAIQPRLQSFGYLIVAPNAPPIRTRP